VLHSPHPTPQPTLPLTHPPTHQRAPTQPSHPQLFLTHLHSDHTADAVQLLSLGPMLGGRPPGPLHVWGPSGPTAETGTAAFVRGLNGMLAWDRLARERVKWPAGEAAAAGFGGGEAGGAPPPLCGDEDGDGDGGGLPPASANVAVAHQFDSSIESQLVFEQDGVKIYSTPVDHYFTGGWPCWPAALLRRFTPPLHSPSTRYIKFTPCFYFTP
jgi:ribonuclease BN (tRNA processing enzyme)